MRTVEVATTVQDMMDFVHHINFWFHFPIPMLWVVAVVVGSSSSSVCFCFWVVY